MVYTTCLSKTNVSFHLRILRKSCLAKPERKGSFIYY
ncbi:MAG: hypothetical protein OQK46_02170 [Gammaproteobacteria bacterium]|nr:hypothetical protein [Gammaproteobacteria bacterium]